MHIQEEQGDYLLVLTGSREVAVVKWAGSAELRRRRGGAGSTGIQRASCLQATRPSACQAAVATRRRRRCPTKITAHRAAVTAASGARVESYHKNTKVRQQPL